jgi:hypothetical protein
MEITLSRSQLATFDLGRAFGAVDTPSSEKLVITLSDVSKSLGSALVVGGMAVIHHGYERNTQDVDLLYSNHDEFELLRRLKKDFKVVSKAKSGWHHLEHRKTKVRLELIPEGGLGTYGFIPGPKTVGSDGGFVSLKGLIWLKLVAGRMQDLADIVILAKQRMKVLRRLKSELPQEFHERYEELLVQAQRELDTDPDPNSLIGGRVREAPARYGKRKRRKVSV